MADHLGKRTQRRNERSSAKAPALPARPADSRSALWESLVLVLLYGRQRASSAAEFV
jgi:hypothetical protein